MTILNFVRQGCRLRTRGAPFALKVRVCLLTEGACGVVFVDQATGRIRKVYRRKHEAMAAHCADTFEAEAKAFEIASADAQLRELVPEWHGRLVGQVIVDKNGVDVSGESYCDLAFEAEFIPGRFEKFGVISSAERERVKKLFAERGITYIIDMSVILQDGRVHKAIDFATKEIELSW